jgi:hypothetical protein
MADRKGCSFGEPRRVNACGFLLRPCPPGLVLVHSPALQMTPRRKTTSPTFRDSVKSAQTEPGGFTRGQEMSRLSFALFIAAALFFTAYFGAAAWRLSDDGHLDVTGQIRTTAK